MIHALPPGIVLPEHRGVQLTLPAQRLDLGVQAVSKPLQILMHLLQDLWNNKESPSAHPSVSASWKGRGLTMLSCSTSGLLPLGPSMHSTTQHDSSLSLCWHSCALMPLFLFFPSKSFFSKLLLAACLDFTKDRSTSVSRLRMTQMHMSRGVGQDGLQRSLSRPVIYCWRRMPGEGLPKTECLHLCRKTSSGLSSYLPVRLEKEGWSSLFSFSLAHNLSTFKFPPCTQLPEGFGHPHFCWAWLTWMESYVCS